MSKSPFYNVKIRKSGRDITNYISKFSYEDCSDQDDLLKISITDITTELVDDGDLVEGTELLVQWGYYGYKITTPRICEIREIRTKYARTIDLELTALDKGNQMKINGYSRIWKNQTASQIIESIVKKYNLNLVSTPTKKVFKSLPQGNRTDFDFIKYLTTLENGYIFYIRDYDAYFEKRKIGDKSVATYTYRSPETDSKVIEFIPTERSKSKEKAGQKATSANIDPLTKQPFKSETTPETQSGGVFVGNALGKLTEVVSDRSVGKNILSPVRSKAEADNLTNKANKESNLNEITATLLIEGDTMARANTVVTIKNVAKRHLGNWYVKKAIHSISKGGGYTTSFELNRNTSKTGTVNKTVGKDAKSDDSSSGTKKVFVFNQNGQRVK